MKPGEASTNLYSLRAGSHGETPSPMERLLRFVNRREVTRSAAAPCALRKRADLLGAERDLWVPSAQALVACAPILVPSDPGVAPVELSRLGFPLGFTLLPPRRQSRRAGACRLIRSRRCVFLRRARGSGNGRGYGLDGRGLGRGSSDRPVGGGGGRFGQTIAADIEKFFPGLAVELMSL